MIQTKQSNFKKASFLALAVIFSLFLSACTNKPFSSLINKNASLNVSDKPVPGQVAVIDSNIVINKPLSNDIISSPLEISGRAKVAEGKVSYRLKDAWGGIIAEGFATASLGAPDWGFYQGQLEFETTASPAGWLEVYTKNTEDSSEENLISLPVVFKEYEKPVVKVYFGNTKENPNMIDCGKVSPLERQLEPTNQLLPAVIAELFKGITEEEKTAGFVNSLPEEGVKVQKLEIKDNILYVDFNQTLQEGVAGSCRVTAIRAQIIETLKQFSEIDDVIISIDGKTEDILQP